MKVRCVTPRKFKFSAKDGKAISKSFNNQPNPLHHPQPKQLCLSSRDKHLSTSNIRRKLRLFLRLHINLGSQLKHGTAAAFLSPISFSQSSCQLKHCQDWALTASGLRDLQGKKPARTKKQLTVGNNPTSSLRYPSSSASPLHGVNKRRGLQSPLAAIESRKFRLFLTFHILDLDQY